MMTAEFHDAQRLMPQVDGFGATPSPPQHDDLILRLQMLASLMGDPRPRATVRDAIAEIERLRVALTAYFSVCDAAWVEMCQEAAKRGLTSVPILPGQAKALEQYNELRRVFGA